MIKPQDPSNTVATRLRWLGTVGLALIVGAIASVVVEAIVAAGWKSPGYSYINDKIAYLGSPYCGRYEGQFVCSPHWQVMEVTWLINGLIALLTGLVLGHAIGGRVGVIVRVMAVAEGVGFALFSLFHDSPSAQANGTIILYFIGAGLVLVAGELLAIILGRADRQLGLPRWLGRVLVALGAVGLVAALVTMGWAPVGLAERISVYAILLWQLLLGGQLLARSIRR